jgi:hypothetical protein
MRASNVIHLVNPTFARSLSIIVIPRLALSPTCATLRQVVKTLRVSLTLP